MEFQWSLAEIVLLKYINRYGFIPCRGRVYFCPGSNWDNKEKCFMQSITYFLSPQNKEHIHEQNQQTLTMKLLFFLLISVY